MIASVVAPLALISWYAADVGSSRLKSVLGLSVNPIGEASAVLLALAVAHVSTNPARRFWRLFSLSLAVYAAADSAWFISSTGVHFSELPMWSLINTYANPLAIGILLVATLTYPVGIRTARERLRFWLDACTVLLGAAAFIWYLVVGIPVPQGADRPAFPFVTSIFALLAVFGMANLVLGGSPPMSRMTAIPFVLACVLVVTEHVRPTPHSFLHRLAASQLPIFLVILGLRLRQLQINHFHSEPDRIASKRRYSLIPYSAIAATDALLLFALPRHLGLRQTGVLVIVITMGLFVIARQLGAFNDNAQLLDRIDASYRELGRQEKRFRSLLTHSSDITIVMDASARSLYVSPAVGRVLGRRPESLLDRDLTEFAHPDDRRWLFDHLTTLVSTDADSVTLQARFEHADGGWRWLEIVCTNLLRDQDVRGVVGNARDVTETHQLHDQLRYAADHDSLTGLANRALFSERLSEALDAIGNGSNRDTCTVGRNRTSISVLLIDLDDFKVINDTYGHEVGDIVLIEIAHRICECIEHRAGTAARLGGDEFAVLLPGVDKNDDADVAGTIKAQLGRPLDALGHRLLVTASVGVASTENCEPERLLRAADHAMYVAKKRRKGSRISTHIEKNVMGPR